MEENLWKTIKSAETVMVEATVKRSLNVHFVSVILRLRRRELSDADFRFSAAKNAAMRILGEADRGIRSSFAELFSTREGNGAGNAVTERSDVFQRSKPPRGTSGRF